MKKVSISNRLKNKCPKIALGILQFDAELKKKDELLWSIFLEYTENLKIKLLSSNIKEIFEIEAARKTYKVLGRDPDRYSLSSESLLKRIKTGKEMYQINNLVDINNYLSVQSYYPIGLYDTSKIIGEVLFDYGEEAESYESLAKGVFNVTNLPIFRDATSAFGSPTSDSKRTCINDTTRNVIMIIISFTGKERLDEWINKAHSLIVDFSNAKNIESDIVI